MKAGNKGDPSGSFFDKYILTIEYVHINILMRYYFSKLKYKTRERAGGGVPEYGHAAGVVFCDQIGRG